MRLVVRMLAMFVVVGCGAESSLINPLSESPSYAVVLSDYTSTSIAMLRADGTSINDGWVSSGSTLPNLVAALSGDVVIARASDSTHLWLLDRLMTDVATQISLPDGEILGQVRTQDSTVLSTAWSSNPQDVAVISSDLAWVSRYEPNLGADVPALESGSDLYAIHPGTMTRLEMRIDLSVYAEDVILADGTTMTAYPRPAAIAKLGDLLVVGLDRISSTFDRAGTGAVVEILGDSLRTRLIEFAGLRNCGRVVRVSETKALVACLGYAQDEEEAAASAGIVTLDVVSGSVQVSSTLRFAEHSSLPLAISGLSVIDENHVLATEPGSFTDATPDHLYEIDLIAASATEVASQSPAYSLGAATYDAGSQLVLVPAGSAGILRFSRQGPGSYRPSSTVPVGTGGLGALQIVKL